ncbi:MAG: Na+/H+ antiporter subunit E [Planctomycetota bacterium]
MRFVVTWVILATFWILLSGRFDAVHLLFGLASVTLVSGISSRHLAEGTTLWAEARRMLRLFRYVPWLIGQIALANLDVLLRVIGLRPVDPCIVRFKPHLDSDFGRVTLANSITLTPGTVTIDVEEDGTFLVHAIAPGAACAIVDGPMAPRVDEVEGSEP